MGGTSRRGLALAACIVLAGCGSAGDDAKARQSYEAAYEANCRAIVVNGERFGSSNLGRSPRTRGLANVKRVLGDYVLSVVGNLQALRDAPAPRAYASFQREVTDGLDATVIDLDSALSTVRLARSATELRAALSFVLTRFDLIRFPKNPPKALLEATPTCKGLFSGAFNAGSGRRV